MRQLFAALLASAVLASPTLSAAQTSDYPARPIRLVVAFAPGGATDTLARLLTGPLGQELRQSIYIGNIAGASGYIGWRNVAGSAPDGYSLLLAENAIAIRPAFKDMTPPFDPAAQLDAVAVTGKQRSPALPNVPTLAEAGIKTADVELQFWFGVFAPKGMPEPIKAKLGAAIQKALQSPTLRQRLVELDITPDYGPADVLQKQLVNEIKNWTTFVEAKGLKAN